LQAALAAADEEAGLPSRHRDADFDDVASEAASLVSGLSIYTDRYVFEALHFSKHLAGVPWS